VREENKSVPARLCKSQQTETFVEPDRAHAIGSRQQHQEHNLDRAEKHRSWASGTLRRGLTSLFLLEDVPSAHTTHLGVAWWYRDALRRFALTSSCDSPTTTMDTFWLWAHLSFASNSLSTAVTVRSELNAMELLWRWQTSSEQRHTHNRQRIMEPRTTGARN